MVQSPGRVSNIVTRGVKERQYEFFWCPEFVPQFALLNSLQAVIQKEARRMRPSNLKPPV